MRDSGECAGAGGLAYGDGDGDFEGTGDVCGVLVTGDGPGAPVGALAIGAEDLDGA